MIEYQRNWLCTPQFGTRGSEVQNPLSPTNLLWVQPGDMGYRMYRLHNNLGPNGLSSGSSTRVSGSKYPKS
jgi:hypothetical protein